MAEEDHTADNYARRYRRTPKGAAGCSWNRLTSRAGAKYNHRKCYASVEVRISREDFMAWAIPAYEAWFRDHPGVTPSVDRIEASGHYEAGNLQLISRSENCRRTSKAKNLHAPEGTNWCSGHQAYLPTDGFYANRTRAGNCLPVMAYCKECHKRHVRDRKARRQAESEG